MGVKNDPNAFVRLYQNRVGEPITSDEVYGYWLFILGGILGVAGIGTYLFSEPAAMVRETAITMAALGLVFLLMGPVVRLPLQRMATYLALAGGFVTVAGVAWFTMAYPANWFTSGGQSQQVIAVYGAGLGLIGLGAIVVPLLTEPAEERERLREAARESERHRTAAEAERDEQVAAASESERKRAAAEDERDEQAAAASESERKRAAAESERDELQDEIGRRDERIRSLESDLDDARATSADLESGLADARGELAAVRESQARFELYEDRGGSWRWRLRHRNGNVTASSGQGFSSKRKAQQGLQSVRRDAFGAGLHVIEPEVSDPETTETDPIPDPESKATFEVYEDSAGEYRWRLVHDNGNLIADSGEGYGSRRDALRGLESARTAADEAVYLEADPTAFEVYSDAGGEYRWRLVHRNGNILAHGGRGFSSTSAASDGVESVRSNVDSDAAEFDVYEDTAGEHRWRLVHRNGNNLADGGQGYDSRSGLEEAVERVRKYAPDAAELDIGNAAFEIFEDSAGKYRWRLVHRNGNILADGGQGYSSRTGAHEGVDSVKHNVAGAEIQGEAENGDDS